MELIADIVFGLIVLVVIGLSSGEAMAWLLQALFEKKDTTSGAATTAATGKEALIGRRVEVLSAARARSIRRSGRRRWRAVACPKRECGAAGRVGDRRSNRQVDAGRCPRHR